MKKTHWKMSLAGCAAGGVNGLFGAGGGMVLVPILSMNSELKEEEIFPASICIILPVCVVSLMVNGSAAPLPWSAAFPYLIGSAAGGVLAGIFGKKIPVKWLHKFLGLLILYGAWRYLW